MSEIQFFSPLVGQNKEKVIFFFCNIIASLIYEQLGGKTYTAGRMGSSGKETVTRDMVGTIRNV